MQEWYIFDGAKVQGPFTADAVWGYAQRLSTSPEHLHLSRKGMERWYKLSEFKDLLEKIAQWDAEVESEKARFIDASQLSPAVEEKEAPIPAVEAPIVTTPIQPAPQKSIAYQPPSTPSPALQYMLQRGRLRLGALRSPWQSALLLPLLTLGGYWWFWALQVERELHWHMNSRLIRRAGRYAPLIGIPLLNLPVFLTLYGLMQAAEAQDHNHAPSRTLMVALLALIPPLAIFYLQLRLNKHWLQHAYRAEVKGFVFSQEIGQKIVCPDKATTA